MLGGFFGRMGRKLGQKVTQQAGEAAPEAPLQQPAQPEVRPQTGAPAQPPPDPEFIDDSIYEAGSMGPMPAEEAATLQGRMEPRRNINLNFFKDDMTKKVIEMHNLKADGFQANPKRRVISHEETLGRTAKGAQNAQEYADRLRRVIGSDLDSKWEPEDLVSIYQVLDEQAVELREYAQKLKVERAAGVETSTEDLAHYQLLSTRFTATQEIASVRAAEAGRMLNALQAVAKSPGGTRQYYRDLQAVVDGAGGEENIWQSIDGVADASNLKEVASNARQSWGAKIWNTAVQVRYNAMLSSVRTHGANILGSTMTGLYEYGLVSPTRVLLNNAEYAARAMVKASTGKGELSRTDRIPLGEIVSEPLALVMGIRRAFSLAHKVFKGDALGHGKVYNELGIRRSDPDMQGGGALPRSLQVPTRLLEAEDAFFQSLYRNARLDTLARRKALAEAGTDAEVEQLRASYLRSPTDEMVDDAVDFGRRLTFTNDPSYYGTVLKTAADAAARVQDHPVGRLILPFVRTPANITGYTLESTALGKFMAPKKLYQELTSAQPEVRADAEARLAIAAGLYLYLKPYWEEGKITGAPPGNYGIYRARQAAGWRDNAIRIGDEYMQLNRLDPLGLTLALYATLYDSMEHSTESDPGTAAAAGLVTVATMLADRSFLSGLGDLERVFQASEGSVGKQAGKFLGRIVTSFITPGAMRDVREMQDPYARSLDVPADINGAFITSVIKSMQNATPWLNENVPPQVDAFGNDMINGAGWGWRGLVPIRLGEIKQDPVAAALTSTAIPVNKPDSTIRHPFIPNSPEINLLALDDGAGWVYREYQQRVGAKRHAYMLRQIKSGKWDKAIATDAIGPESQFAEMLRSESRYARQDATAEFLQWLGTGKRFRPKVGDEYPVGVIEIQHPFDLATYKEMAKQIARGQAEAIQPELEAVGMSAPFKPEQKGLAPELRF